VETAVVSIATVMVAAVVVAAAAAAMAVAVSTTMVNATAAMAMVASTTDLDADSQRTVRRTCAQDARYREEVQWVPQIHVGGIQWQSRGPNGQ